VRAYANGLLIPGQSVGRDTRQFAADVRHYLRLMPRQLPSRYLYDPLGSALFEAICRLPWYGVTRAEARLLVSHRDEIFEHCGAVPTVVELGSGSGEKLRALLQASTRRDPTTAHLIDVSPAALATARASLGQISAVQVVAHEAEYEDGLEHYARQRHASGTALALFLGSNIGNFDRPGAAALLASLRRALVAGDWLLLGADLVKPKPRLLLAYDDPLGVTAAFNRNLLVRINNELLADFEVGHFAHRAIWNETESRVEMHLVSTCAQTVRIGTARLEVALAGGEFIWTESSYKYRPDEIVALVEGAGFRRRSQWVDEQDPFALTLFQAV